MEKKAIYTEKAGKAVGPYSQAIEYNDTIYLSGVTAVDPEKGVPDAASAHSGLSGIYGL